MAPHRIVGEDVLIVSFVKTRRLVIVNLFLVFTIAYSSST
jgi:hypothetical protein